MNRRAGEQAAATQRQQQRDRQRLDGVLGQLQGAGDEQRLAALRALVRWLRPRRASRAEPAQQRLKLLTEVVREDAAARAGVRNSVLWLTATKQPLRLLTDSGILANEGFFSGLWHRLGAKVLPDELDTEQLSDALYILFERRDDHVWVEAIADAEWVGLLDALDFGAVLSGTDGRRMPFQILEALQVTSYRIAAMGLEPELVRNHPAIERYESPFLTQNVEMRHFIDERRQAISDKRDPAVDDKHLLVLLGQCDEILGKVRKQAAQTGASVSLTVLLARLTQNIARLKLLLLLLERRAAHDLNELRVRFFKQVVRAENRRNSVGELWTQTLDLLSTRIVSNASKAGEQYITSSRAEFFRLFRSAMGAGLIVVLASLVKLSVYDPTRAPFVEALVYSGIYAAAFVLMYVFHFSLATKQPAMTANAIAQAIETGEDKHGMSRLADLMVRTFRSQFIALVGNLVVAVPLALFVAQTHWMRHGEPYLSPTKATHLLADTDPLSPHVWIWAAITGICLFATGLISGYYDNKAAYGRIPRRVRQLRWLRRLFGVRVAEGVASYVENNLGGLMGSVFFGVMLGSVGALGRVFGVPMDTLHVTFTSANTTYAMAALQEVPLWQLLPAAVLGVSVIGLLNLAVSFSLALYVAMRAQRVSLTNRRALIVALLKRFVSRPQDFFWPPRPPVAPPGS
ncbi:MAG: site-specific recombinase [Nevskiales bacterium]|nr:site-specific recombinase [Nevskiales bacterium]